MEPKKELAEKIIVALDVRTKDRALDLVKQLKNVQTFKVGLELFTSEGTLLIQELHRLGKNIFLDLKMHDIPNTVAGAVRSGFIHKVSIMTLHAFGGVEMMRRAAAEAKNLSEETGEAKPLLLAVTILTSLKGDDLRQLGIKTKLDDQVLKLAFLAKKAGMDGLVCSPRETKMIKKEVGKDLLIVNPGIRPSWASSDDQKRVTTPAQAVKNGADLLVIGRPVTQASEPEEAFLRICRELDSP
ncbi:MAG TPA: orotidine-5'-phosphate decarboxylase [Candidatus Aminicenantes bacterium]|nr:orotidine-5'-phosphate decarboxylase [Candidatus Aminicenantes bacterium]